jgi:hypothetical protein
MNSVLAFHIPSAVQIVMGIGCTLMRLSHVLQPRMWRHYFEALKYRVLQAS